MNMVVQISAQIPRSPCGCDAGVELLGHVVVPVKFEEVPYCFHIACTNLRFQFPHIPVTTCSSLFLKKNSGHFNGCEVVSYAVVIYISLFKKLPFC